MEPKRPTEGEENKIATPGADAQQGAANDNDEEEVTPRKKIIRFVILAIVLLVAAAWGVPTLLHSMAYEKTDDAFVEGRVISISPKVSGHVLRLYVDDNQEVTSGTVLLEIDPRDYQAQVDQKRAALDVALARQHSAEISVGVTQVTASAGVEEASSGLAQSQTAVEASQAAVNAAQQQEQQAKVGLDVAQTTAERSKAGIGTAEAESTRATKDLERLERLVKTGAVSRQEYDKGLATAQEAAAKLTAARKQYDEDVTKIQQAELAAKVAAQQVAQAQSALEQTTQKIAQAQSHVSTAGTGPEQVRLAQAQLVSARAEVAVAQANLEQALLQLSYTKIRAPEDGRVTRKSVEAGAFIQVGQPLMALVTNEMWVVANYKETQLTHMHAGQPVDIRIDAFPNMRLTGKVQSIQSGTGARFSLLPAENATGNYVKVVQRVPVKIVFDQLDPSHRLVPGMSVEPEVRVK